MGLNEKLIERKTAIAEQWLMAVLDSYPHRTAQAWKKEKNRFANPVGHTLTTETQAIVDLLLQGGDLQEITCHLEPIVRVRSIQEFTPAESLGFVYMLKGVVRKTLAQELDDPSILKELVLFENKIDQLALLAFNIYTACRERLCDLRVNEVKRSVSSLLRRANLIVDEPEPEPEPATPGTEPAP